MRGGISFFTYLLGHHKVSRKECALQYTQFGFTIIPQLSASGENVLVSFYDNRPIIVVRNDQDGRWSFFYQSFSGASGKKAGQWYPCGGLAKSTTHGWIVKADVVNDPGYGRQGLLDLYQRVNEALPHDDASTAVLLNKLTGTSLGWKAANESAWDKRPNAYFEGLLTQDVMANLYVRWRNHYLVPMWGTRS
jgi:hypothetical protein